MATVPGYDPAFIGKNFTVSLPDYSYYSGTIAGNISSGEEMIPYTYYSVLQHKVRRLPIFSASNIFRPKFSQLDRTGDFKRDPRLQKFHQLSREDYEGFNSILTATIDRGHMTKREDVQWDMDEDELKAGAAAESTFFYPNAAPQHKKLNIGIWKSLENSIIVKGRVPKPARICVLTGPVLDHFDLQMKVDLKDGAIFQVPVLFWKIVYYTKQDNNLYYAAFLMGQHDLLQRDGFIDKVEKKGLHKGKVAELREFLEFTNSEQYQVPISMIENLTNLKFSPAIDLQKDKAPSLLSLVQAKGIKPSGIRLTTLPKIDGLTI